MGQLKTYTADHLLLSPEESKDILTFFFGDFTLSSSGLTVKDRSFAQALLIEALEKSNQMGIVEAAFTSFFMKSPRTFQSIAVAVGRFISKAGKYFRADIKITKNEIYESVRTQLVRAWKSEWNIRLQTDEYVAY